MLIPVAMAPLKMEARQVVGAQPGALRRPDAQILVEGR